MQLWLNFLIIFILILINGFFAAAEMALVSINKYHIKHLSNQGNIRAQRVMNLTSQSTKYLSTIQVAITFAGFLSSALAGSNLSMDVVRVFAILGITMHQTVAMVIVTIILSFVTLVLGELVPKRLAMSHADQFALLSSGTVQGLMIAFKPFVWLLTITTDGIIRLFGGHPQSMVEKITEDEIRSLILRGHLEGLYRKEEKEMIDNVFKFDDLKASQIMIPRTKVFALSMDDPTLIEQLIASTYSRVVIYKQTIDNIKGILHVKDVFYASYHEKDSAIDIKKLLRKPVYIPEDMPIKQVFTQLKSMKQQFAVLVDEYGGTVGILTMEDLIEEIVGNLYDEHDILDASIKQINPNKYLIKGDTQIQDINHRLGLNIDENDDRFDTLNGLIIMLIGKIPAPDDMITIDFENITISIEKVIDHTVEYAVVEKHE